MQNRLMINYNHRDGIATNPQAKQGSSIWSSAVTLPLIEHKPSNPQHVLNALRGPITSHGNVMLTCPTPVQLSQASRYYTQRFIS